MTRLEPACSQHGIPKISVSVKGPDPKGRFSFFWGPGATALRLRWHMERGDAHKVAAVFLENHPTTKDVSAFPDLVEPVSHASPDFPSCDSSRLETWKVGLGTGRPKDAEASCKDDRVQWLASEKSVSQILALENTRCGQMDDK